MRVRNSIRGLWTDPTHDRRRLKETRQARVARLREWADAYKSRLGCGRCGNEYDAIVLDFHHRDPAVKDETVSHMIAAACSLDALQAEVKKCDVLCANCHRRTHHDERIAARRDHEQQILPVAS